jgi:cell division protein FtsN
MAATEPSAAPVPSVATDGYVVQVSSQRSREQAEAAFADLQQRYASVLGGLSSSVQEAEVEGKGTYYRVRVGPWATRDEAITVCETLKGAGGACFVTQ